LIKSKDVTLSPTLLTQGGRSYPVAYAYDAQGRLRHMTNWTTYPDTGARVTSWVYDAHRGWLTNKVHADGKGTHYGYTDAGRLSFRVWARGTNTTYAYNPYGDLASVNYDDGVTPSISYSYNRLGRQELVSKGSHSWQLLYTLTGQLTSEAATAGPLSGLAVTNRYDDWHRRTSAILRQGASALTSRSFTYDAAGRMASTGDGTYAAAYSYLANSDLIAETAFKQSTTVRMTTTRTYDMLNRLRSTVSTPSASSAFSHTYTYNPANQRTRMGLADGSYWAYEYDDLGQVTRGNRYWSDGTPVAGQQFEYGFDNIGNRTQAAAGGDAGGDHLAESSYSVNAVNQYTQRDVPGQVDVFGMARGTVTVNSQSTYRRQEYFWDRIEADNSSDPVWLEIDVVATDGSSIPKEGHVFIPETPEVFSYDDDGNLTGDGRCTYGWDAENRLILMLSATSEGPPQRIEYDYDFRGRRITKKVWNNTAGTGTPGTDLRFIYDDWNQSGQRGHI